MPTGFALMNKGKLKAIASKGGTVAHELGKAHRFNHEEAVAAGKKGGAKISQNLEHMREIGRKGGKNAWNSRKKRLMAEYHGVVENADVERGTPAN